MKSGSNAWVYRPQFMGSNIDRRIFMNAPCKKLLPWVLVAGLVLSGLLALTHSQPAHAQAQNGPVAGPRYSVIDSEAHNLIVVDNKSNTLYFYTIDKGKEVGAELKLRGTIDLNQVGQPVIKPQQTKAD
jgi:hypothetical protein